ncbi:MAG: Mitochondrial distribution and morphology protein 35 [Thelocarpon impressellum]|nr:MAG: Mitochondrial distribution and morphology protein 35 [Thelocarpon impressellum]
MSASLATECNEAKERYDSCFLKWYSEKFLKGNASSDECAPLFHDYQSCLTRALKDKGLDKMIEEARKGNNDNDPSHPRQKCAFTTTH